MIDYHNIYKNIKRNKTNVVIYKLMKLYILTFKIKIILNQTKIKNFTTKKIKKYFIKIYKNQI